MDGPTGLTVRKVGADYWVPCVPQSWAPRASRRSLHMFNICILSINIMMSIYQMSRIRIGDPFGRSPQRVAEGCSGQGLG